MSDHNSHTASSLSIPPKDWVETTLGEVCEIKNGKTNSQDAISDGEYPLFDRSSIIKKSDKYIFNTNAIIIPGEGAKFVPRYFEGKFDLHQRAYAIYNFRKGIADSVFFFYQITNSSNFFEKIAVGSTVKSLRINHFIEFPIYLPPLSEQKAIASVLSAFDIKIELLREQKKILEEMGQVIFQESFGKYGLDDKLPEGWRVFELSEIVDIVNGYAYKGSDLVENSNEALVTLKSFDRNGGFQTRGFKPFIGKPKETQEVKIGDLVVAHTDLTQDAEVLGNPAFIFDDGGFQKMFITMDLVKVVSKDENITNAFLYYLMKTKKFKGHCVGYANGTTVLHLSKKAIPEYQIALPENFKILSDVSLLLKETTDKIADINSQIQTLANTRDEILPKLMSGVLRVNDFNKN